VIVPPRPATSRQMASRRVSRPVSAAISCASVSVWRATICYTESLHESSSLRRAD
jgi:hypothetical protein